jgi:hypothetical protein
VAADATANATKPRLGRRARDEVAEALMVALGVVMLDELTDGLAQMALAKWDDVPQAFLVNRPNESFGACVQSWGCGRVSSRVRRAEARMLSNCAV